MHPSPVILAAAGAIGVLIGRVLTFCIRRLPPPRSMPRPNTAWSAYFIVECVTAAMCLGAVSYYGVTVMCLSRVIFGAALIVLFAIDLEHRLLPNVITLPGIAIGWLFSLAGEPGWQSSLTGIALGGGVPFVVAEIYYRLRGREGLGMGDVKMLAMIGAFLGGPAVILTLMVSSIAGSLAGLLMIVTRRGDRHYALPFGTFLAVGAAFSATLGVPILEWLQRR